MLVSVCRFVVKDVLVELLSLFTLADWNQFETDYSELEEDVEGV